MFFLLQKNKDHTNLSLSFWVSKIRIKQNNLFWVLWGEKKKREILKGKALVEDTDMPIKMQIQAMASASHALDLYDVLESKSIAAHIKQDFDKKYGGGWQCVVGSNFSCFFTHSKGTFIYFTLETLKFLIFKGAISA